MRRTAPIALALAVILALVLPLSVVAAPPPVPKGPRLLASAFDETVLADTAVFTAVTPGTIHYPNVALRLTVGIADGSANSIVVVTVTDGTTTHKLDLNNGTTLTNGRLYAFKFGALRGSGATTYSYSVEFETGTKIAFLLLEEVQSDAL